MSGTGTGIFLEPQGKLLDALCERKRWLDKMMPGQAFCCHPPHCTLLYGDYGPPASWLEKLRQTLAVHPPFELETNAWLEFPHDAQAGGGHTIAYRVQPNPALSRLQQTVADCLIPYVKVKPKTHPLALAEPFASSLSKFGFPFVGDHWLPHFTIGSPMVSTQSPLLAQLMSGSVHHRFTVRKISVWYVAGDRHDRLHELALAGEQI